MVTEVDALMKFDVRVSPGVNEKGFFTATGSYAGEEIIVFARNQKRAMAFFLDEVSKRLKIIAEHEANHGGSTQ